MRMCKNVLHVCVCVWCVCGGGGGGGEGCIVCMLHTCLIAIDGVMQQQEMNCCCTPFVTLYRILAVLTGLYVNLVFLALTLSAPF